MKIEEFDYHLQPEMIAQYPLKEREKARLLLLNHDGKIEHKYFTDLPEILNPGDLLVFNDSKVIRARIRGKKETGGKIEILLIEQIDGPVWRCLCRGKLNVNTRMNFDDLAAEVVDKSRNNYLIKFNADPEKKGEIPLPPYIRRPITEDDGIYYQNIFAKEKGSVAAATAGLHFSENLLNRLRGRNIDYCMITCHIRPGIFQKVHDINEFQMASEPFSISPEAARKIRDGQRVIAVGTSVVRVLESFGNKELQSGPGKTDIFITPGFRFQKIAGLITNFHLPMSPPMIMVSAFIGTDRLKYAYHEAMNKGYRFLSYGDGMLII